MCFCKEDHSTRCHILFIILMKFHQVITLKIIFINTISNSSLKNQWKFFVRSGALILNFPSVLMLNGVYFNDTSKNLAKNAMRLDSQIFGVCNNHF